MKPSEVIPTPIQWCKGAYARTASGERCGSTSYEAVCWCGLGAIGKALDHHDRKWQRFDDIYTSLPQLGGMPGSWNDQSDRTHEEVLAALKQAEAIYAEKYPEDPL